MTFNLLNQTVHGDDCKERRGSILTKTLKTGSLIPINISRESAYCADFKYISLIKFSHSYSRLRASEHFPDFHKKGKTPPKRHRILRKILASDSEYQETLL